MNSPNMSSPEKANHIDRMQIGGCQGPGGGDSGKWLLMGKGFFWGDEYVPGPDSGDVWVTLWMY